MSDSADFAGLTEGLCHRFWGKPTSSTKAQHRWGSGGSRSFNITDMVWFDHEAGKGGGAIELVMRECSTDRSGALAWMEKEGLIDARHVASAVHQRQEAPKPSNEPAEAEQPPAASSEAVRDVETDHYDYTDRDGTFQYRVIRYEKRYADGSPVLDEKTGAPKKTFKQKSRDASGAITWGLNGRSPCLYRWPLIEQAAEAGRVCYIVEGEKDVHTLEAFGLDATTNSGGAQNWRPEFSASFKAARVVVLIDNDDAGRERGKVITELLTGIAASVKVIDLARYWAEAPHKSDVTDWVKAGGTKEALLDIVEGRTKPSPPVSKFGAKRTTELAGKPIIYDWLVKGLVERNGVLMFAGEKQSAKTFAVMDMGFKIARNLPYGDRKTRQGVVIHMACEDGKGVQMRAEGYRIANDMSPDADVPYVVMDPNADGTTRFSLMSDESVDGFIKECLDWRDYYGQPLEFIIIDTLSKATEGLNEIDGAEVGKVLARVDRIRLKTGATVCLVHHMNASGQRMRGHSSLGDNVPNVIEIKMLTKPAENRRDPPVQVLDGEGREVRQLVLTKNKNGLNNLKWKIVLQVVHLGYDQDGDEQTTCVCVSPKWKPRDEKEERHKMSPDTKLVFDALQAAMTDAGQDMPAGSASATSVKRCAPQAAFEANVRKTMTFTAPEGEIEQRNKELAVFIKRTTTGLINSGYMGRDNDQKIVWWTGKSDRPRPRYQEQERPPEQPGAGIADEVKQEIAESGVPF